MRDEVLRNDIFKLMKAFSLDDTILRIFRDILFLRRLMRIGQRCVYCGRFTARKGTMIILNENSIMCSRCSHSLSHEQKRALSVSFIKLFLRRECYIGEFSTKKRDFKRCYNLFAKFLINDRNIFYYIMRSSKGHLIDLGFDTSSRYHLGFALKTEDLGKIIQARQRIISNPNEAFRIFETKKIATQIGSIIERALRKLYKWKTNEEPLKKGLYAMQFIKWIQSKIKTIRDLEEELMALRQHFELKTGFKSIYRSGFTNKFTEWILSDSNHGAPRIKPISGETMEALSLRYLFEQVTALDSLTLSGKYNHAFTQWLLKNELIKAINAKHLFIQKNENIQAFELRRRFEDETGFRSLSDGKYATEFTRWMYLNGKSNLLEDSLLKPSDVGRFKKLQGEEEGAFELRRRFEDETGLRSLYQKKPTIKFLKWASNQNKSRSI